MTVITKKGVADDRRSGPKSVDYGNACGKESCMLWTLMSVVG
jgi:hypothetical protein